MTQPTAGREGERELCRHKPGLEGGAQSGAGAGLMPVALGRHTPLGELGGSRGDDEGAIGPRQRLAKGLHGAALRLGRGLEAGL